VVSFILILFFLLAYLYFSSGIVVKEINPSGNQNPHPEKRIQTEHIGLPSETEDKNNP
jgi:hypothetical protein